MRGIGPAIPCARHSGIEPEAGGFVDPRSLVPMDYATILGSVRKTGRLVVADPSHRTCSPAAEIAATVAEEAGWPASTASR